MGPVVSCINPGRHYRHCSTANKEPDTVFKERITHEKWLCEQQRNKAALRELARTADARIQRISHRGVRSRKCNLADLEHMKAFLIQLYNKMKQMCYKGVAWSKRMWEIVAQTVGGIEIKETAVEAWNLLASSQKLQGK